MMIAVVSFDSELGRRWAGRKHATISGVLFERKDSRFEARLTPDDESALRFAKLASALEFESE